MKSVVKVKNAPPGRSDAKWRQKYQADVLRKYPLGNAMPNPLFNNYRKRYGGSNSGGASIGGGT